MSMVGKGEYLWVKDTLDLVALLKTTPKTLMMEKVSDEDLCPASYHVALVLFVGVQVELVNLLDLQMLSSKDSGSGDEADSDDDNRTKEKQLLEKEENNIEKEAGESDDSCSEEELRGMYACTPNCRSRGT